MEAYENRGPARLWAEGLVGELKSFRRAVLPRPPRRFCIFAQGRTGSTLLTSLLDSHPDIRCEDEILRRPRLAPLRFLDRESRGREAAFGFHLKPYHLTRFQRAPDPGVFLRRLADEGWSFVHLTRVDIVAHVFSTVYAKRHGWHRRDAARADAEDPIEVDPARFVRKAEKRRRWLECERAALEGLPAFPISYEDDLVDPVAREARLRALLGELGLAWAPLSTPLRKSVGRSPWELMANPDAVRTALRRAGIAVE